MASPSPRAIVFAAALGLVAALPATAAAAPTHSQSLGWTRLHGAESCIGTRALAEAVEARLGRQVFVSAARAEMAVEGSIEGPSEGGPAAWHAVLKITGDHGVVLGTRELHSESATCRSLDDELVLVIAVMIDPDAALRAAPQPPPPAPLAPTAPPVVARRELAPPPACAPAPPPSPPVRSRTGLEAGAIFSLGLLPNLGAGVEMRGRVRPPRWPELELGGAFWFPNEADGGALGTKFVLAEGILAICPLATSASAFELSACVGIRAGFLHAGGFGFSTSLDSERFTFTPSLTGRVRRRIAGPLIAEVGIGVLVPVLRDRFYFAEPGAPNSDVFRMSQLVGTVEGGLGIELP